MNSKQIGLRIKSLRAEKGLRQEEVSALLNVTRSNLSKIESGDIVPTARILIILGSYFDISLDWLMTGVGTRQLVPGDASNEVRPMLRDMEKYPQLKYAILSYYYTYKSDPSKFKPEMQTDDQKGQNAS